MPRLILASTSPYRRTLLERLRVPFECRSPLVDEEELKRSLPTVDPDHFAVALAREKARSVAEAEPEAVVLGGDQLVAFGGQILGKPGTREAAISQLLSLAGYEHQLVTAVVLIHPHHPARVILDIARLAMRSLTVEEAARYVDADSPLDCAGSYKLESLGIALFDRIDCADHTAITGLPLLRLADALRDFGFAVP